MSAPSNSTDSDLDLDEDQENLGVEEVNIDEELTFSNLEEESQENQESLNSISNTQSDTSSIQVSSTAVPADMDPDYDPNLVIELGDRVYVKSDEHPQLIGMVYYRDGTLIRIQPDGMHTTLIDFELEETDDGEEFKDKTLTISILEKRTVWTFVEQQDFRAQQLIKTYSKGQPMVDYTITYVNAGEDRITIEDEAGDTMEMEFDMIGIKQDAPFDIIFITGYAEKEKEEEEGEEEVSEEDLEDVEKSEENNIEFLGFIDIALPKIYRMAESHEQYIPDHLQKIDAFNDFISGLDPAIRNDPKTIRSVRLLVETLFYLKQSTILYDNDKTIIGAAPVSATTLVELIQRAPVPLGRAVLAMCKKEYSESENLNSDDDVFFLSFEQELQRINQYAENLVSMLGASKKGSIVALWNHQQSFLSEYGSPWRPYTTDEPLWRAITDTDVFRSIPPTLEDETLPGYIPSHKEDLPPIFDKVPFGLERALSTTYRNGKNNRKQALVAEDESTIRSYLLFPISCANTIGSTRSRSLASDSGRSQLPRQTMKMILEELGEPKDMDFTPKNIALLRADGGTLSNIPLSDYIQNIYPFSAFGFGDVYDTLDQYGMDHLEINQSIADVLEVKIKRSQDRLISALSILRAHLAPAADPEPNPFLIDPNCIRDVIAQPILKTDLDEYQRINPSLAESDLGQVNDWMKRHPNYFQVAVGKNPLLLIKAQTHTFQAEYLNRLQINNIIRYNEINAGIKPRKNNCPHVSNLVSIRRLRDDVERFQQLAPWFKQFQGARNKNWFDCNRCNTHLLCIHEHLQLQAFLHPFEKAIIEKDILLHFSGGQFQGKYICRNCGQPIRELDFDNHIEFDDNGKPKSGRAVLVDEDAQFEDQIDAMLSLPIDPPAISEFIIKEDDQAKCYRIIRQIANVLGVSLETKEYRNMIDRIMLYMGKFPQRDSYNTMREKNTGMLEYDVIYSRLWICSTATFLLIEIQCKIPSQRAQFPIAGCGSPGFGGYPLDMDESKQQGLKYVACAVASIQLKEEPWIHTKFKSKDLEKRQAGILQYMLNVLKDIQGHDMIQVQLAKKRKYVIAYPTDELPATFLPEPVRISMEDAAKDPIIPEVVGYNDEAALARLWIRHSHALAKQHATLIRGSPMIETSCCPTKIETPGAFWKEIQEKIPIKGRSLQPRQQGNFLLTNFIPRDIGISDVKPDSKLYYRLFLKYCFVGNRVGHPHEPGLTNICPWCKFEFPSHPAVLDSAEGEAALSSQQVETTGSEFTTLLDTIHRVNYVDPFSPYTHTTLQQTFQQLADVEPAPYLDWKKLMEDTSAKISTLTSESTRKERTEAIGNLSIEEDQAKAIVFSVIKDSTHQQLMEKIATLSWNDFFNVLQTYIIIPFQRIVSRFNGASLFIPHELRDQLSDTHVTVALEPILKNEVSFLTANKAKLSQPSTEYIRARLQDYIRRVTMLLPFKNKIRPVLTSEGEKTPEYQYIQSILFYAPLSILFNRSIEPEGVQRTSAMGSVTTNAFNFIRDILVFHVDKYNKERLSYSDEDIKILKAVRDEKERTAVIQRFDRIVDPEEKAVELMKKNMKMGEWYVGKNVYAYNADYWDQERQKRIDAGIIDFPGHADGQMDAPQGREYDENGLPVYGDNELDSGYDMAVDDGEGDTE